MIRVLLEYRVNLKIKPVAAKRMRKPMSPFVASKIQPGSSCYLIYKLSCNIFSYVIPLAQCAEPSA